MNGGSSVSNLCFIKIHDGADNDFLVVFEHGRWGMPLLLLNEEHIKSIRRLWDNPPRPEPDMEDRE